MFCQNIRLQYIDQPSDNRKLFCIIWKQTAICFTLNSSTNMHLRTEINQSQFAGLSYKIGKVVGLTLLLYFYLYIFFALLII